MKLFCNRIGFFPIQSSRHEKSVISFFHTLLNSNKNNVSRTKLSSLPKKGWVDVKIDLRMKLSVVLLIIGTFVLQANSTYSQKKISLKLTNITVERLLDEIESKTDFRFVYSTEDVDMNRRVDVDARRQKVGTILKAVFAGTKTAFSIDDGQIFLLKDNETKPPLNKISPQDPIRITGKVTDSEGVPLPGATVLEKGTSNGVATDFDGNYEIHVSGQQAVLVFTNIGFQDKEAIVGNQTSINIELDTAVSQLDDVVVIGYGTITRKDLTGSVSSFKVSDQVNQLPNISIAQSLQGSVPGLNVGMARTPGEEPSFTVRGNNTLSTSQSDNAPLIVLDGVIFRGNLIDLNTNDIESVDVLKDVSSAAIYGSQASNGVILITSKKGARTNKPIFNYSTSFSLQRPYNEFEPMGRKELDEYIRDTHWSSGSRLAPDFLEPDPDFSFIPFFRTTQQVEGYQNGFDHDLWGAFTGTGYIIDHNLNVSGKSDKLSYFVSGGVSDVKGYLENDDYKRYNARINLDYAINDWLNVGVQSFFTTSDYSGVSPNLANLFRTQPWTPVSDDNGEYYNEPGGWGLNPYLIVQIDDEDKRRNLFGNFYAQINFPFIEGLSYKVNYAANEKNLAHMQFNPWGASYTGSGYSYNSRISNWSMDNILTYKKSFNGGHNLNLTLVYGVEEVELFATNATAQNFENPLLGFNRLQAGDPSLFGVSTNAEKESSLYSSGRLIYNYKNKYFLTGTVRRDGFSGFGEKNKIAVFPSLALAWVPTEETFFQIEPINYLKFRGAYGLSGRRGVSRYDTKAVVSASPSYVFGDGNSTSMGQWISKLANDDLAWETTAGINLGVDFALFNSRLSGNVEYYRNDTKDILFNIQLPQITGFSSISSNIGKVRNWGTEFSLTGKIVDSENFSWNTTVNFSRNRNEIVSILGPDDQGEEQDIVSNRLFIGEPLSVNYGYEITGEHWQLADEEAGTIPSGFLPGTLKIVDQNNDGQISAADDMKILGYQDPSYRFGIANSLNYKNLSLYFFINSIQGGKDYYRSRVDPDYSINNYSFISTGNGPTNAWDYWMPENPNAKYRRLDTTPSQEGFHYDQRNFARLQDLSLSYQFDDLILRKLQIEGLRIFISGKNLLTLTKWEGIDPEINAPIQVSSPVMSSYTLGLNINF